MMACFATKMGLVTNNQVPDAPIPRDAARPPPAACVSGDDVASEVLECITRRRVSCA